MRLKQRQLSQAKKTMKAKSKYTRKQILESIKYWKKQLKNKNYKKLNESLRKSYDCKTQFYYTDDYENGYSIRLNENDKNLHFSCNKKTIKESLYAFKQCIEQFFKKHGFIVNVTNMNTTITENEWECFLSYSSGYGRAIRDLIVQCNWKIPYTVDDYDIQDNPDLYDDD